MDSDTEKRINVALDKLKNELVEMRSLDIKLMRQLLSINDTIQKLTKGHTMTRTQSCKSRISTKRSQRSHTVRDIGEKPIRRLQSTPSFSGVKSSGSCSSLEDTPPVTNGMFYLDESDEDIFIKDNDLTRYNSMSCIAPLNETNDNCYEEILRANIKVWKSSLSKKDSDC